MSFFNLIIKRSVCSFEAGRVALVTGAASGIGRSVCQILAANNLNVVVADINKDKARETSEQLTVGNGLTHCSLHLDVACGESVKRAVESVNKTYGTAASILVNCAGITRDGFMLNMSEDDFDKVIDVNLKGTFLMTKAVCQNMIDKAVKGGAIVNVSSVSGKIGNMGQCNYSASKAAVESFTRSVAKEMAMHNIRCNAVMPGFIETPIIHTVPEKLMKLLIKNTPLGRVGKPEEVAEAIVFLASNKSSFVTGATLQVSGGLFM
ncbi:short-chain alcohol dehydrogenase-like protein [Dinothrombium tinctorium]|uniref:(3R)-3-hydroxyacyl-CoA dehydrogenase n=1 Tax=Dinothrombium tinctorium TaxID=1965070 RepID=A0A443QU61_9ACAR|nr:short-chain alcohol dehydrogenase-like protein [Dinothrombium tinctorium]